MYSGRDPPLVCHVCVSDRQRCSSPQASGRAGRRRLGRRKGCHQPWAPSSLAPACCKRAIVPWVRRGVKTQEALMQKTQNSKIFLKHIFTFGYISKHCPINFFQHITPTIAPTLGITPKRTQRYHWAITFPSCSASGMCSCKLCSGSTTCYGLNCAPSKCVDWSLTLQCDYI